MSKICYIPKRFSRSSIEMIDQANEIIEEYQADGFTLTLRQLYYQFVSKDLIANKQSEYKRLGSILNKARLAGLVDWDAMEDRTRGLKGGWWSDTLESPEEVLEGAAESHSLNNWDDQPSYVEVWIEKDALVGVIERVCSKWGLPYFACRGYNSQSEQYLAGRRFGFKQMDGREVHILHLGDHDPSGIDMTHDNKSRLDMFTEELSSERVHMHRLALNMDQVEKYSPPPNPAKMTDSRFANYVAEFGKSCWELDALKPKVISQLIEDKVKGIIDFKKWKETDARQEEERDTFRSAIEALKGGY